MVILNIEIFVFSLKCLKYFDVDPPRIIASGGDSQMILRLFLSDYHSDD